MSSLFRQKTVIYRTKGGKVCRKGAPGAVRKIVESKKWYGEYQGPDRKPVRRPLTENKEAARTMLAALAGDAARASVGLVDPKGREEQQPLLAHLDDFRRYLASENNTPQHVSKTVAQCRAILDGCQFVDAADLEAGAVLEFLAGLRQHSRLGKLELENYQTKDVAVLLGIQVASVLRLEKRGQLPSSGRAPGSGRRKLFARETVLAYLERRTQGINISTSNHYLTAIKHFSKWLMKKLNEADPLGILERLDEVDCRHERRTLNAKAFALFIRAAQAGRSFRNLTGSDRAFLYQLASRTGLRAGELASLAPESFDLVASPATVTVRAAHSKHRRKDVVALRKDVAGLVASYLTTKPAKQFLWPSSWAIAAAEMVRLDLEAAGIPYMDDRGQVYDFHALRHQFISDLARAGVHPKEAQELARHSTITLTMDYYTHLDLRDRVAALDKLPALPDTSGAQKATLNVGS